MRTRKIVPLLIAVLVGIGAVTAHRASLGAVDPIDPVVSNCNVLPPTTPITPALLTSGLPCAATIVAPFTLNGIQHGFDYYSWLTFLSLNTPADGTAPIGKGSGAGGDAPAVWDEWQDLNNIMPANGSAPPAWGSSLPPPPVCVKVGAKTGQTVIQMIAKLPDLEATNQPFADGPLIDQTGHYTRYQILVNKPMFEYIAQHHLYNKAGQAKFPLPIEFPDGNVQTGTTGTVGAIMIKAAWKVLDGKDNPADFHTMVAYVYTPPSVNPRVIESCRKQTVALVGLHIVHKTKSDPQWVWSTFEHIRNAPTQADAKAGHLAASYNYYNAKCSTVNCPVNSTPPPPWNPDVQPFPNGFASQIERLIPLQPDADQLNVAFQGLLKGSVWQNYKLISTQWPTNAKSKVDPTGSPAPAFLGNTTMETYIQGRVPNVSSSCIRCHNIATDTAQKNGDFTYILSRAK